VVENNRHLTARPTQARANPREDRLQRLFDRLPKRIRTTVRWLRRPSARPVRAVAGVLLVGGAFLSILPVFGLWMAPLGLMLLAEDIPALRRARDRALEWIEHRRPHWFARAEAGRADDARGRRRCNG
jgi:hypothetical protein